MKDLTDWLALMVGLMGVFSTGIIAFLAYSLNKQAERAQAQRAISESYDKLINYRSEHPEVLRLSYQWTEACFGYLYSQATDEEKKWVYYYNYAELCLNFINSVLYGRKSRLLDKGVYESQYGPLIKLLLTEHNPLISILLQNDKYISKYIKEYRQDIEKAGWQWSEMHRQLTGSTEVQE